MVVAVRKTEIPKLWVIVLLLAAALTLAPFTGWIVVAIWLERLLARPARAHHRRFHGRVQLAALATVTLLTLVLVPIGIVLTTLVIDSIALITELAQSGKGHEVLVSLVEQKTPRPTTEESLGQLLMSQGDRALAIVKTILSGAAQIVIGLVILLAGTYTMLIDGKRWYQWADTRAPIGSKALRRMADAFTETGRGLAFGVLGAGLLQALVATAAYLVLQVPQALALGLLTLLFSIVPVVGTAAVWVPVAAGLAITGRLWAGLGLAIYGIIVIGSIDNFARPWLARRGKLQLPTYLVLVSMFGAVEVFGGWGVLFGPLLLRLAKEALELRREAIADVSSM